MEIDLFSDFTVPFNLEPTASGHPFICSGHVACAPFIYLFADCCALN